MSIERNSHEREHWERVGDLSQQLTRLDNRVTELSQLLDQMSGQLATLSNDVRRVAEVAPTYRSLLGGGLAALIALLAGAVLLLFQLLHKEIPPPQSTVVVTCGPTATQTPTASVAPTTPTSAWHAESACFTTTASFFLGRSTDCDPPLIVPSQQRPKPTECPNWTSLMSSEGRSLKDFLQDRPNAFGVIDIFAGHDAKPIRMDNRELDSNFDLAHRRAVTVARNVNALLSELGHPERWSVLISPGSVPAPPCSIDRPPSPSNATATPTPKPEERRRPAIRVTVWSPNEQFKSNLTE